MSRPVQVGALAFLGPAHTSHLTDFQYVEVVSLTDCTVEVKISSPDVNGDDTTFEVPLDVIGYRLVPDSERKVWPGSCIAYPVAFVRTSNAGVGEWSYGVVSGYTASETADILHIASSEGPARFPLTSMQSVIKVDPLNYTLRPGQGAKVAALSPMELLHQQDALLAAYRKRTTGVPASIMTNLSVPYSPDEMVPLVKPSTLGLVHVRRQHIVDFSTASRTNRPEDLFSDNGLAAEDVPSTREQRVKSVQVAPATSRHRSIAKATSQRMDYDNSDADQHAYFSEDDDIQEVQHMNTPLSKHRCVSDDDSCSDNSTEPAPIVRQALSAASCFFLSPTDRRIHAAIVNRRHTGKIPQTLLHSVQQSSYVEFVASPAVLRGLYTFGFGLGLSIMHCGRAHWDDEVATSKKGVNLWDFSSKNGFQTPPKSSSFAT